MKYFTLTILSFALLWTSRIDAQSRKIPFVEHFSNSQCPICINNRAKIESDLAKYNGEINTMTIHHRPPYPNCELYLFAKEEVDNRVEVFSNSTHAIPGSPSLVVNGVPGSHSRLTINIDEAMKDDAVLVGLNMTETGINSKKVTLDVYNLTNSAMDHLYVYAALVEKSATIEYKGTHTIKHVFRKFLGTQKGKGDPVGPLAAGASKTIVLEGTIPNGLSASNFYVVAWVEERKPNGNSYDIIMHNSVSQTTSTRTNTHLEIPESELSIFPNPATHSLQIRNLSTFSPQHYRILGMDGKEFYHREVRNNLIHISDLPVGSYMLILENQDARITRKFVKQ